MDRDNGAGDGWEDRSTGIFTAKERELLISGDKLSESTGREARSRVRRRLRDILADFEILVKYLPETDRRQVLEGTETKPATAQYLPYLAAFVAQHHESRSLDGTADTARVFEDGVEIAADDVTADNGTVPRAEVDIDLWWEGTGVADTKDQLENNGVTAVDVADLERLYEAGEISLEEYREYLAEKSEQLAELEELDDETDPEDLPSPGTSRSYDRDDEPDDE